MSIGRVETVDVPARGGSAGSHGAGIGDTATGARAALVVLLAAAFSLLGGVQGGVFGGLLIDTDSYTRISRIVASLEAGTVLHHVPRDNAGDTIALHWSHLLDGLIVVLALPLAPLLGWADAVRWAGAALGPLTAAAAALTVMMTARLLSAGPVTAFAAGVLAALSQGVLTYGALGRADHHVLLGAFGLLAPVLAYVDARGGVTRGPLWSGIVAGLGLWISPEILPFVLLSWAIAGVRDTDIEGRFGPRATAFCGAFLSVLVVAMLVDPPPSGRWSVELDRLSRPFLELAGLMMTATLVARRLPALPRGWPAAIGAGVIALLALVPWALMYPSLLQGAEGMFSAAGWTRMWRTNNEMRSPLGSAHDVALALAVPLAVIGLALVMLLWRRRQPVDVLAFAGACLVAYLACRHIRLAIYLQLAAAIAAALAIQHLTRTLSDVGQRLSSIAAVFGLALTPFVAASAFKPASDALQAAGDCDARAVAADLEPFAGRTVLTWINDAPMVLYFSRVTVAAAPYHRAERRIFDVLDTFAATTFAAAPPDAFRRIGASAVLVCPTVSHDKGSLGEALAKGQPPAWLTETPIRPVSRYRLYVVR